MLWLSEFSYLTNDFTEKRSPLFFSPRISKKTWHILDFLRYDSHITLRCFQTPYFRYRKVIFLLSLLLVILARKLNILAVSNSETFVVAHKASLFLSEEEEA
uniref:Uncharacterized protein n=1 Tax=Parascaris equorum TaxID=6256 RepID=A0A914RQK3_PAREQ